MKLRNKKTGEIIDIYKGEITLHYNQGRKTIHFKRLEDLEEWEDYEEPKVFYVIDIDGEILPSDFFKDKTIEKSKELGNYFSSREEVEQAVEKLKAWKRLKDKGFKVDLWDYDGGNYQERIRTGRILFRVKDYEENDKDLDLLFGGEE